MDINIIKQTYGALANNTRLRIIEKLYDDEELSCQDISNTLNFSQSTISHHFKVLIQANILTTRKEQTKMYYKLNRSMLDKIGINLHRLFISSIG